MGNAVICRKIVFHNAGDNYLLSSSYANVEVYGLYFVSVFCSVTTVYQFSRYTSFSMLCLFRHQSLNLYIALKGNCVIFGYPTGHKNFKPLIGIARQCTV